MGSCCAKRSAELSTNGKDTKITGSVNLSGSTSNEIPKMIEFI